MGSSRSRVEEEEGKGGVAEGARTVIVDGDVVMLSGDGDMSDQGPRTMDVGMVALSILKFLDGVRRNLHEQEEWLVKRNTFINSKAMWPRYQKNSKCASGKKDSEEIAQQRVRRYQKALQRYQKKIFFV